MEQQRNNNVGEILKVIKKGRKIVLAGHVAPDGDSIGSLLGFYALLKTMNLEAMVISEDPVPSTFNFLAGFSEIRDPSFFPSGVDVALVLDCTSLARCGEKLSALLAEVPVIINIDHHISNSYFGHLNYVDPAASATGELVYRFVRKAGIPFTPEIATCIYTAIAMDTGSFKYDNTSERSHAIAAYLIKKGVPVGKINTLLFEEKPLVGLKLLGEALKTLQTTPCGRVAWMEIDRETMLRLGASEEHTDGIVNYPKMVAGVEVGILLREVDEELVKVGLRSKGQVDVNQVAAVFGGGGHPRAAGFVCRGNLAQIRDELIKVVLAALPEREKGVAEEKNAGDADSGLS